ncbi:MAG: hypothetical protein LBU78_06270 [Microbacterium sp.]|jgi:hypothetical protein|nr:hypothetical protein [Microbacterium sp.]
MSKISDIEVTRRTLTKGAAWSLPVIAAATAVPMAAASGCTEQASTLDFSAMYQRSSITSGTAVVPVAGQDPVTVSFSSVMNGYTAHDQNYRVGAGDWDGLQLQQVRSANTPSNNQAYYQLMTITFSREVTNLVLPIRNFSWPTSNSYGDQVWLATNGQPGGFTFVTGSGVGGDGSYAQPFRRSAGSETYTGPSTNVTVTFPGPVTSIMLAYDDKRGTLANRVEQAIALGDMTFVAPCPAA